MKLLIALMFVSVGHAAKQGISGKGNWTVEKTVGALKLPVFNRKLLFKGIDQRALGSLETIAFDEKYDMSLRWRALTSIAIYGTGTGAEEAIRKASFHERWFLRNASLVGANHISRPLGLEIARRLLNDPAMVVRAAAAETLGKSASTSDITRLWREMENPRNFRHGKGLWIRSKIAKTLSHHVKKSEMHRAVKWLDDGDQKVRQLAVATMERLTGVILGKKGDTVDSQARYWKSWWGQRL